MARRSHVPVEFLRCRTWGHAWEDFVPLNVKVSWGELWPLRCTRCGMERHDTINVHGALGSRRYIQPDGYKLTADETPTREVFRVELSNVLVAEHREPNKRKAIKRGKS